MQTERDGNIVYWVGRFGAVGAEHVIRHFEMSRSVAYARLNLLVRDGLLEHHSVLYGRPGMYTATSAGLRWQGNQRLGRYLLSPGGFEHAWQVAQIAVELKVALPEWTLLSERDIRAIERDHPGELLASAEVGIVADRPTLHRPDLALISRSERVVPIEVELSVKSASRLARICRGWRRARHIDRVYYLATAAPARALTRAVRATQAIDRIHVLGLVEIAAIAEQLAST